MDSSEVCVYLVKVRETFTEAYLELVELMILSIMSPTLYSSRYFLPLGGTGKSTVAQK